MEKTWLIKKYYWDKLCFCCFWAPLQYFKLNILLEIPVIYKFLSCVIFYAVTIFQYLQGDSRTYSYVAGLSSDKKPNWQQLSFLAQLIPRICMNVNRYYCIFYFQSPSVHMQPDWKYCVTVVVCLWIITGLVKCVCIEELQY